MSANEHDVRLYRALCAFDALAFAKRHGGYKESRGQRSHEYLLTCPECGSDRLRWRHEPKGKMAWVCWGCNRTGDSFALIRALERCDLATALKYVLDGYVGGDAPQALAGVKPAAEKASVMRTMPWPAGAELLMPHHAREWAYVAARGITPEQVRDYRLGVGRVGKLEGYVIFPVFMDGGLTYWQGRASWDPPHTDPALRKEWIRQTSYRKTLNPTSEEGFATAADVLFGYDRARASNHIVVCEGPVDAIKVGPHAVALFGKAWSPAKVARLLRLPAHRYTVYLDNGEAERASALALAAELSSYVPTFIARPPAGYDAGALTPEQNAAVIAAAEPYSGRNLAGGLKP